MSRDGSLGAIGTSCGEVWLLYLDHSRFSRVPSSHLHESIVVTSVCFLSEDDSEFLVVAYSDKRSRERSLVFVDVDSLTLIGTLRPEDHIHAKDIAQVVHCPGTLVTSGADAVMVWTYMGSFDINHRLKDPVDVVKRHASYHPPCNEQFIKHIVCSDTFACVLTLSGCISLLSFPDLVPLTNLDLPDTSVRSMSVFGDLLLCIGASHGKSAIDVLALKEEPESVARFTCSSRRILSASMYDEETVVVLSDDGNLAIVDIIANQLLGSTASVSKLAMGDFVSCHEKIIVFGQKNSEFEIFQLRQLGEQTCPVTRDIAYFDLAHTDAPSNPTGGFEMFSPPISMKARVEQYVTWLELPLNVPAVSLLQTSPDFPTYSGLWSSRLSALPSSRPSDRLITILGLLTVWNRDFLDSEILPQIIFPFVKLFSIKSSIVFTFELVMWFLSTCALPLFIPGIEDGLGDELREQDPELYAHVSALTKPVAVGEWLFESFASCFLSESLAGPDWLLMLDMLVFYLRHNRNVSPANLGTCMVVNFPKLFRTEIFHLETPSELVQWTSNTHRVTRDCLECLFVGSHISVTRREEFKLREGTNQYPNYPLP